MQLPDHIKNNLSAFWCLFAIKFSKCFLPLYFQAKAWLLVASLLHPCDDITVFKASNPGSFVIASQLRRSVVSSYGNGWSWNFLRLRQFIWILTAKQTYQELKPILIVSIWAVLPGYDMDCGDNSVGKASDLQVWAPM